MKAIHLLNEIWIRLPRIFKVIIGVGLVLLALRFFASQQEGLPIRAK